MSIIESICSRVASVALLISLITLPGLAADIDVTAFGGVHRQGKLTLQSAPNTTVNLIRTINSTTFGSYGVRIGHGRVFGGEHTLAFSPNFIDADTKALIYNSNLLVHAPLPVVRPYVTAGLGLIHTSGDSLGVFGTKLALNYGGGVKFVPAGPVGLRIDVRGYSVPSVEFRVFTTENQRIDFLEASIGILFRFGDRSPN
jgi:opacity protein-like surface antigen